MQPAQYTWFLPQTSQKGIECTKAKEYLRSYCPNIYTVIPGHQMSPELQQAYRLLTRNYWANWSIYYQVIWFFLFSNNLLESFPDFLIELDMKPRMHIVETSIFSLNNVTARLTKIMNNLLEHIKILIFKVIFSVLKIDRIFQKKKSFENIGLGDRFWIKS